MTDKPGCLRQGSCAVLCWLSLIVIVLIGQKIAGTVTYYNSGGQRYAVPFSTTIHAPAAPATVRRASAVGNDHGACSSDTGDHRGTHGNYHEYADSACAYNPDSLGDLHGL